MVESIWLDIQQAARTLRASPLFTAIAVLSLSVGIAGTTVIFGLTNAYLLHPRSGIADNCFALETPTGPGMSFSPCAATTSDRPLASITNPTKRKKLREMS